jgi:hypothetical protein
MQIDLEWGGVKYIISDTQTFKVAGDVEDIITLADLGGLAANPKFTKIAAVYGLMLRSAGARVKDSEVWESITAQMKSGAGDSSVVITAISTLVEILMNGAPEGGGDGKKESVS